MKQAEFHTPILFLIFNRPEQTYKVFSETIQKIKPAQLYISADGPRKNKPGETAACEKTRKVTDLIDWECTITTRFLDENRGCKEGVSSGIDWFFDQVEEGIILEDDCLVDTSFFTFAAELLEKYRTDERVMHISASNFSIETKDWPYSYYFSYYNHIWGWASWRSAWKKHYNLNLSQVNRTAFKAVLEKRFERKAERNYFLAMYDYAKSSYFTTWDYQWTFSIWAAGGLSISPVKNLVSNIGFGAGATNTQLVDEAFSVQKKFEMDFPLKHPELVPKKDADQKTADFLYKVKDKKNLLKVKIATYMPVGLKNKIKAWL